MLTATQNRILEAIRAHAYQSRLIGLGRTLIAVSQLSVLVFTPSEYLFVPVGSQTFEMACDQVRSASAYCIIPGSPQTTSYVLMAILALVASGLLPRLTAPLHFWASFSMASSISLPDGGESVAQVMTFFLVFALAGDRRRWHWAKHEVAAETFAPSALRAVSWSGAWALRLQVAYLYANSSLAKLSVPQWQEGSATYYVARMESFGSAGIFGDSFRDVVAIPLVSLATSWGSIVAEFAIAILVLMPFRNTARATLCISIALHTFIGLMLGIVSFAVIMVGSVTAAVGVVLDRRQVHDAQLNTPQTEKLPGAPIPQTGLTHIAHPDTASANGRASATTP
ncbi:sporulation-delaying protein SdpB family protein [Rhodococcus sp. NBC_00294]|uniref:sporulation-delaying protein SdpB family protein n=1 Tax=Rhodococcus sp. NBC_00294 TaxID=2976004 RepID=UPI002E2CD1C8|nr:sporulation-delaying protein SdpB family protein [Rhodococcus sp. NBC_00294]